MNYIYFFLGVILYAGIVCDIFKTTLSMQGGGWFTSRFCHFYWKVLLKLSGRKGSSSILASAGFHLLILIIVIWVGCLLGSLFLLLISQPNSVINASTKLPAGILEKLYYAGFVLSTSGIGDYIASSNLWRMITNFYSFTGLILITMSVTYFIPVLSAVIKKRTLGLSLSSLQFDPKNIQQKEWNSQDMNALIKNLQDISQMILEHNQNHRAYPVIHFFHNSQKSNSIILQLAKLHETLCIVEYVFGVSKVGIPEQSILDLRSAFNNYILIIEEVSHMDTNNLPEPKPFNLIKLKGHESIEHNNNIPDDIIRKRCIFQKLVIQDGWEWSDLKEI